MVMNAHETEADDANERAQEQDVPVASGFLEICQKTAIAENVVRTETMKPPIAAVKTTARVIGMRSIPDWIGV